MNEFAQITLTRGQVTTVDRSDYEWLSKFRWCAVPAARSGNYYAKTKTGSKQVYMHRMIAGVAGFDVDHKDHNGLNNTRVNLRVCTRSLNIANTSVKVSLSGLRGVYWEPKRNKWVARAKASDGRTLSLGRFDNPIDAAKVRDAFVLKRYGEFAFLNFPQEILR